jgi:two-component system OmpR family sensor kinase/two-component system sensor histidine kinase QseC
VQLALDTVARLAPLAESRNIDLGITRQDRAIAMGTLADFEVVLDNLVENTVRYTPPGGTVDIAVRIAGREACVEVSDTGPGISEDDMPHIFERFFRARPQESEGSGLGLAKAAAERQGARLTLAAREDRTGLSAASV